MTKRAVIVSSCVLVTILIVVAILFGAVFRVRDIKVVKGDDFYYSVDNSDIISAGKLNYKTSIFDIKRDVVKNNIESSYPYARVKVNIDSITSVKILLSNRMPLYYFVQDEIFYILDEDCKILDTTSNISLVQDLVKVDNAFSVSQDVKPGTFIRGNYSQVCGNLYKAIYTNATIEILDSETSTYVEKYLNREDICEIISNIKFSQVDELDGRVDKLHITTNYGVQINIIEPNNDLNIKINRAFSALRALQKSDRDNSTSLVTTGSINVEYEYDSNGNARIKCDYRA
ncbi:MAG: cell division protein FtsQ/DivIB [Clostridia bacterium]